MYNNPQFDFTYIGIEENVESDKSTCSLDIKFSSIWLYKILEIPTLSVNLCLYTSLFVSYITDIYQVCSNRVFVCRLWHRISCGNEKLSQANHNLVGFT